MIFVGTKKISKLNHQFFKRNGVTNVIAFPLHFQTPDNRYLLGDVVICPKVAEKEADVANISPLLRIIELLIHGILHLDGYTDKSQKDWSVMRKKQEQLLDEVIKARLF